MNKNTTCTTGATLSSKSRKSLKNVNGNPKFMTMNGTSGCLYVTNVNLYLHPSPAPPPTGTGTGTGTEGAMTIQSEIPKIKTRCYSPDCFYYDNDILGDEFDYYYCCNPGCSCFKPDWYSYL